MIGPIVCLPFLRPAASETSYAYPSPASVLVSDSVQFDPARNRDTRHPARCGQETAGGKSKKPPASGPTDNAEKKPADPSADSPPKPAKEQPAAKKPAAKKPAGKKSAAKKPAEDKPAMNKGQEKETKPAPKPQPIFTDAALQEAVRREVFEKRYNDEPITKEDVANISRVVGKGKGIKSLEGLQHCTALMLIDLEDNEISDLQPIAELKRLQSVTLAGNQIKNIKPLENLTAMQLLDLSGNQVEDLSALKKCRTCGRCTWRTTD